MQIRPSVGISWNNDDLVSCLFEYIGQDGERVTIQDIAFALISINVAQGIDNSERMHRHLQTTDTIIRVLMSTAILR